MIFCVDLSLTEQFRLGESSTHSDSVHLVTSLCQSVNNVFSPIAETLHCGQILEEC